MAEAIHCPSCTTRYRLRPERVRPVTRRAKCFACGDIFPVSQAVARVLGLPDPEATAAIQPEATAAIQAQDLVAAHVEPLPAAESLPVVEPQPTSLPAAPSLTLGDLEGVGPDALEETLVVAPEPLPEPKAETRPRPEYVLPAPVSVDADMEATASGYTSARDAIDKLFGSAPMATPPLKIHRDSDAADLEASLSALDTTLGPTTPVEPPAELTEDDLGAPSRSTMRLSQEHLQAIAASAPAPAEPTVALRVSDVMAAKVAAEAAPVTTPAPATRSFAPFTSPEPGAELLRLKIGEEIYGGLTMPQLITWVDEGRILENHLVARQHSENWLEAHKVPGLRPIFERMRRERSGGAPSLDPDQDSAPKKSLFGGLFGKN